MTDSTHWRPTASIENLKKRAEILADIRQFFQQRNVMEVETPAMSQATVTDEHLHCFETRYIGPGAAQGMPLYLQTSPEYAMKRLLAAGSGCIYQLGKAFRNEEAGRFHNPEFTMLEWYRLGFTHIELMDEVEALIVMVLKCETAERFSYQQAFQKYLHLDPLTATLAELQRLAADHGFTDLARDETDRDTLLQLLFSQCVEPNIGLYCPCFIHSFPASQAALARINADDSRVADRFELYFKGVELANGFYELADVKEQRARFDADNQKRVNAGRPQREMDERFLAALDAGLPDCAGVALGVDRLMMLALNAEQIADVIAFPVDRC